MHPSHSTSFASLATAPCPPHVDMLLAIEAELSVSDPAWVTDRLDDRARGLFGLAAEAPSDQAIALVATVCDLFPQPGLADESWFLTAALRRGLAADALRAALAADLGRRAGVAASVAREGRAWRLIVKSGHGGIVADPRLGLLHGARSVHPVCGHHIGFAVLGELAAGHRGHRRELARRACRLQLRLPIDDATRAQVEHQLGSIDDSIR
jgi:hypothetical protein